LDLSPVRWTYLSVSTDFFVRADGLFSTVFPANWLFTIPKPHDNTRQLKLVELDDDWKYGINVPPVLDFEEWSDLQISVFGNYVDKVIQSFNKQ